MPKKIAQIEIKLKALKDLNEKVPFNMLELFDNQENKRNLETSL